MKPERTRSPLDPFMLPTALLALWSLGWRLMTALVGRRLLLGALVATSIGTALYILITGG